MGMAARKTEADFFFTDETTGERFDVLDGCVVGRTQGDYRFPDDPRMSGRHGRFTTSSGNIHVEDMNSRNGVIVNGKKIVPETPFRIWPGDMIEMGNHTFCLGRSNQAPLNASPKTREDTSTEVVHAPSSGEKPKASSKGPSAARVIDLDDLVKPAANTTSKSIDSNANARPESGSSHPSVPDPAEVTDSDTAEPFHREPSSIASSVVFGTLSIMGALFVIMVATGVDPVQPMAIDIIRWGGNYGPETTQGQWWRLLTSAFVHAGLVQLIASGFAFWQLTQVLLSRLGAFTLLAIFAGTHTVGALTVLSLKPHHVGYGALAGLLGLYGALAAAHARDRSMPASETRPVLWMSFAIVVAANLSSGLTDLADAPGLALAFVLGGVMQVIAVSAKAPTQPAGALRVLRPIAAIIAVAAVIYMIGRTISPVVDPSGQIRVIVEKMLPLAERYDHMREQTKSEQSSALEMITAINSDFLPTLRGLKKQLDGAPPFDDERQSAVEGLKSALSAWEHAWTYQAQGLATNDTARLKEAMEFEAAGFDHLESATRVMEQWKRRPAR